MGFKGHGACQRPEWIIDIDSPKQQDSVGALGVLNFIGKINLEGSI